MNRAALIRATLIGTVAQVAMVLAGHFILWIKDYGFAGGGVAISLVIGMAYVWLAFEDSLRSRLLGGAVAGGVCAFIGILVSVLLKDTPAIVLAFGTVMSAVAGLVGAAIGRLTRPKAKA